MTRMARARVALVPLFVGGLLGFIGGYFTAGGGRPQPSVSAPAQTPAGDRVAQLRRDIERDPESPKLWTSLGDAYYDREDWDRAIEAYEKARRKAPRDPNLLSDLAAAHRNRGELRRAAALFEKAHAADPDHWQSLLNLVLLQAFDLRDPEAARRHLDELKRRYPEIPDLDRLERQIAGLRGRA